MATCIALQLARSAVIEPAGMSFTKTTRRQVRLAAGVPASRRRGEGQLVARLLWLKKWRTVRGSKRRDASGMLNRRDVRHLPAPELKCCGGAHRLPHPAIPTC